MLAVYGGERAMGGGSNCEWQYEWLCFGWFIRLAFTAAHWTDRRMWYTSTYTYSYICIIYIELISLSRWRTTLMAIWSVVVQTLLQKAIVFVCLFCFPLALFCVFLITFFVVLMTRTRIVVKVDVAGC